MATETCFMAAVPRCELNLHSHEGAYARQPSSIFDAKRYPKGPCSLSVNESDGFGAAEPIRKDVAAAFIESK